MNQFFPRLAPSLLAILFIFSACGQGTDSPVPAGPASQLGISKEIGLQCLTEGDLACARKNYCGIHGDPGASLRCCLATFLNHYFSENTARLGEMLGYEPVGFSEFREKKLSELLAQEGLPFGELFLLGKEKAPGVKDLLKRWGLALIEQGASTHELRERLGQFGAGLEETVACLDLSVGSLKEDQLEKEVFQSEESPKVQRRDIFFLQFALGLSGYVLQGGTQYELGADHFPALPLADAFLQDVNGLAGEGDERFGELDEGRALQVASEFPSLERSFTALLAFSQLKDHPSKVDAYLNWRLTAETQNKASEWLKVLHASLTQKKWQPLPDREHQINLGALTHPAQVPNSRRIDPALPCLERDSAGEVQLNRDFIRQWAAPVVK